MSLVIQNIVLPYFEGDLRVSGERIVQMGDRIQPKRRDLRIDASKLTLHPGFINAHDHLEMNLYPRLGKPPYRNYTEWGKDIYRPKETPLIQIEGTDLDYRLLWGGLKNLISGATTVVHHNRWRRILGREKFPVEVVPIDWAHSLAFEKKLPKSLSKKKPFVIHAAEGVDALAQQEIRTLHERGLLQRNSVIIHGVAMGEFEIMLMKSSGAAMVWCPSSNLFMFNKTSSIRSMSQHFPIALGTDSTLTGSWCLLEELRAAQRLGYASDNALIDMVGRVAANIFRVPVPSIEVGAPANFFLVPKANAGGATQLLKTECKDIAMVIVRGEVRLALDALAPTHLKNKFRVQGSLRRTDIDVAKLKHYFETKVGAAILDQNPLWQKITV